MAKEAQKGEKGIRVVARNKRARFDYQIESTVEAGLSLLGSEVKGLREGNANLADAYALPKGEELYLVNCRIGEYKPAAHFAHEPTRARRLLLHRREIDQLLAKIREKGYSLVPISLYFKDGYAKVELGLGRGKTFEDRRETIKERESKREMGRAMRRR